MNSYLENLPSIVGNMGEQITVLHEFVLTSTEISGGTRLTITSLRTGEVQVIDLMDGYSPVKGVDYWTADDQAALDNAVATAASAEKTAQAAAETLKQAQQLAEQCGYAQLEVGEDGCLYLSRTDNIVDNLNFTLNEAGELEVLMG